MTTDGDLALTRLASYCSTSNMPASPRLTFNSSYSSYAPRASSFRASSLERSFSSINSKISSSSRLTPGVGYTSSSSRRPPLPASDVRRVAAARASPGRPPPGTRREPSTDPDTLTEARRYLQERRDRLTRSESREPTATSTLRSLLSSSPASSSAGRLTDRMEAASDQTATSAGTLSRRYRPADMATSPTAAAPRERVVPISVATDARPSVGELRRQFDSSRGSESRGDDEAVTAREAAADRMNGGRVDLSRPEIMAGTSNNNTRTAAGASTPDKEPSSSSVGRRSALYGRDSAAAGSSSRRLRADQEGLPAAGRTSSQRASDSARTLGLTGLRNIGNTCFMNSVLQCLSNTRALHEYILRDSYSADINNGSSMKGGLVKAFASLMSDLWRATGESDRVLTTAPFKSQVQRFAPRFMGYQQQDAQEFLRYLLEGLHEDVNRVTSRPKPITTDIDENLSASQMSMEAWKRFLRLENSKFVDLFVGQLKSTLRCTVCGHASMTFDPFWDLSLPIPSKSGQVRLQSCFDLFTKEEVLDGDEKPTCSKCKKRQKCTKAFSIQKFPRILVVHLKRFSPMERFRGKLGTAVDFPISGLDLSQYSAGSGPCKYNLYGVANHSGTLFSGHYTAHCKHPQSGEWHEYNDARVRPVTSRAINSAEAYVLFFELCGASHL